MGIGDGIDRTVAKVDFGKPSARKRGKDPRWPYVPVIEHAGVASSPKPWQEQVRGLAFATRTEAVSSAKVHIAKLRLELAKKLADPRMRALRERYGLPRDLG
jgi:hypothetical protein